MASSKNRRNALRLLTAREVLNACEGDHGDGGGLILRVRGDSGAWVFRYSSPTLKRRREMGLGKLLRNDAATAGKSLTQARTAADAARLHVAAGRDPIEVRDESIASHLQVEAEAKVAKAQNAVTLARFARDYHERIIEPNRSAKHSAQWIASLENHVGDELWQAPITQIEAGPLLDRLMELNERIPETAGRIRQRLEAVFNDAVFRNVITVNPAATLTRKLREAGPKRKQVHFRALPFAQAPSFWTALQTQPGVAARALAFLTLTASRTKEVQFAAWNELDLDAAVWRIPGHRMKGGEEHVVELCTEAVDILKTQQKDPNIHEEWVFPSPTLNGKPLSNMAFLNLLRRMKLGELTTAHGLRATFSSWANETGRYRSDVIEACLAHQEADRVRRAYNRAAFTRERKKLLLDWANFLGSNESSSPP